MNTLIAPLGKTPAVITETLDYLMPKYRNPDRTIGKEIEIDRLVLVYPAKQDFINDATLVLEEEWCNTFKKSSEHFNRSSDYDYLLEYSDILTPNAVRDFERAISDFTFMFSGEANHIFYSMSGGRKTMAAVMAYLAQFYKVSGIFHVISEDRWSTIRESNAFFKKWENTNEREQLLYPDPINITSMQLSIESLFPEASTRKVNHFLQKKEKATDFTENESILFDFLSSEAEFITPECMNQSLTERIDDSLRSFEKKKLSDEDKQQAARMISQLLKKVDKVHHLKYHRQRKNRWWLYRYDQRLYEETQTYVIEAMLPISDRISMSFHIATMADSVSQGDENWFQILKFFKEKYPQKFKGDLPDNGKFALISSMGKSPGVITEAVQYFEQKRKIKLDKIVIVAPENRDIKFNGIREILHPFYGGRMDAHYASVRDVENEKDLEKFIVKASEVIKKYHEEGYDILLNFAGGRKSMSAAMVRLAQLGHIEQAFHILITNPELEDWCIDNGSIKVLSKRREEDRRGIRREDGSKWDAPIFPDLNNVEVVFFPTLQHKLL